MHPKNKLERKIVAAKKNTKRKKPMQRSIELSTANALSALEHYMHSMHLIDAEEKVISCFENGIDNWVVYLEKEGVE